MCEKGHLRIFKYLYCKLVKLFAMGDVGSLARAEAAQLAESLAFVLGIDASDNEECEGRAFIELAELDPDDLFRCRQADLPRVSKKLWQPGGLFVQSCRR